MTRYPLILIVSLLVLLSGGITYSQDEHDYEWWNNKHNWDGVTHWSKYLIFSPAYLGPNALPVPEIMEGNNPQNASFELRGDFHFSDGDDTQNIYFKFYYPFFKGKVALEVYAVPIEWYQMDTITRDERFSRDKDGGGHANGDINIGTRIQIVRDHKAWPDIMLRINLRTASGNNVGGARFTDMPGYFFDLSAGKSFPLNEKILFRPYVMLGFYVWQTNLDRWFQNDAFLYGAGFKLAGERCSFDFKYGGYIGFIGNGDAPIVMRINSIYSIQRFDIKFAFQQGLWDFKYSSFSIGTIVHFGK